MNEMLKRAIAELVDRSVRNTRAIDALQYSQAALNLAYVSGCLRGVGSEGDVLKPPQKIGVVSLVGPISPPE